MPLISDGLSCVWRHLGEERFWLKEARFRRLFSIAIGDSGLFAVSPVVLSKLYKFGVAFFISVIRVPHYLRNRFELIIDVR